VKLENFRAKKGTEKGDIPLLLRSKMGSCRNVCNFPFLAALGTENGVMS
jgi:hypothetical protein